MNTNTRLPLFKYCCNGQHAKIVTPIKSAKIKGALWKRAIYLCHKCNEYTIRGETEDRQMHTTSVKLITKETASKMIEAKKKFVQKMRKKNE